MGGEVEILGLGGAIDDVPEEDSAFSNRQYLMWLNFAMAWDDADLDADYIARIRACAAELKPWTGNGVYVNMLNADEDRPDRVVEAYGADKYARLTTVKAHYDPDNFFRANYNIAPR
jgi:FAD/FMN-containing dehydrogenase